MLSSFWAKLKKKKKKTKSPNIFEASEVAAVDDGNGQRSNINVHNQI